MSEVKDLAPAQFSENTGTQKKEKRWEIDLSLVLLTVAVLGAVEVLQQAAF